MQKLDNNNNKSSNLSNLHQQSDSRDSVFEVQSPNRNSLPSSEINKMEAHPMAVLSERVGHKSTFFKSAITNSVDN